MVLDGEDSNVSIWERVQIVLEKVLKVGDGAKQGEGSTCWRLGKTRWLGGGAKGQVHERPAIASSARQNRQNWVTVAEVSALVGAQNV